jgi:hypothetical protein
METFISVVNAVWHFVFYLGEYVNHTFGKILIGFVIGWPLIAIVWSIFFQYFVKVFVYWGIIVYHQAHMDKKFDGTQEEFVKLSFRQRHPKTWPFVLFWSFAKKPLSMFNWDHLDLIGKLDVRFYLFTFKIYRTENLKKFIENGWDIPVENQDG